MTDISGYIYLDSDDRDNKPNPNVTDITFPVNFRNNLVRKIALSSYDFSIGFDNINESNQTAYIDDGSSTYVVTLPIRTYDFIDLRSEIILTLDALGLGAWTITLNQGSYDIVAPVPVSFLTNPVRPNGKDWADMIGMEKDTPLKTIHIGNISDIAYTSKIYITSQDVHRFKTLSDESASRRIVDCLGVVYTNANLKMNNEKEPLSPEIVYPHKATREISVPKWIQHNNDTGLGIVRIVLLDDRGYPIPQSQQSKIKWSVELLIQN